MYTHAHACMCAHSHKHNAHTHTHRLSGTGIRLEDDVLVLEDGPGEVLNVGCPESLEELTALIGIK